MDLTKNERIMLRMMSETEYSQYGECYGEALDGLLAKGAVEFADHDTAQAGFIAKGKSQMYRALRLTDAGFQALKEIE